MKPAALSPMQRHTSGGERSMSPRVESFVAAVYESLSSQSLVGYWAVSLFVEQVSWSERLAVCVIFALALASSRPAFDCAARWRLWVVLPTSAALVSFFSIGGGAAFKIGSVLFSFVVMRARAAVGLCNSLSLVTWGFAAAQSSRATADMVGGAFPLGAWFDVLVWCAFWVGAVEFSTRRMRELITLAIPPLLLVASLLTRGLLASRSAASDATERGRDVPRAPSGGILIFVADSLRSDHVAPAGSFLATELRTRPHLIFENAVSPGASTRLSLPLILGLREPLGGRLPLRPCRVGEVETALPFPPDVLMVTDFPEHVISPGSEYPGLRVAGAGRLSIAFQVFSAFRHLRDGRVPRGFAFKPAHERVCEALRVSTPREVVVHVWPPHSPYGGSPYGTAPEGVDSAKAYEIAAGLAHREFERVVGCLPNRDAWTIAFTSDHGECLGEVAGYWGHGDGHCDTVRHVPLVIFSPQLRDSRIERNVTSTKGLRLRLERVLRGDSIADAMDMR
jgi:hypothetical protein